MVKWMTIVFGAVPILGWLASMPYNWWAFGTPFTACGEWNNFPLWIVTSPCWQIYGVLDYSSRLFQEHPYPIVVLYTFICTILYALAGFVFGLFVRGCVALVMKNPLDERSTK